MKPLILHIRASNFFGGPEKQILGHIALNKNMRNSVLTFIERGAPNELYDRCRQDSVPVETVTTQSPYNPSTVFKLRHHLERMRPDIICCHGYKPAILSIFARLGLKIPLIVFARGHTGEDLKVSLFEKFERFTMRHAEVVVSVSEAYVSNLIKWGVAKDRIRVVHNAVDASKMNGCSNNSNKRKIKREELGFKPTDLLIGTAGRLSPEKAQTDLIRAFPKVYKEFPQAQLLIIGNGPLRRQLEDMAVKYCIPNVYFLGFRKDFDEILAVIDLFVLPSLTEGFPNVILEAFACEKPVVAANVGGVPEIVQDGVNGLLVPTNRPDLLAEAILKCLSSPEMAQLMGEAGYHRVQTEFTPETQNRKLEEIYTELLQQSRVLAV